MKGGETSSQALRRAYAGRLAQQSELTAERVERAFATVPRERYLPPPPWLFHGPGLRRSYRSGELSDVYTDNLIALDVGAGINNGEPSLHFWWMAALDIQPGERICHIGAGAGYYTAILAELTGRDGLVRAYEVSARLAQMAEDALSVHPQVTVIAANAATADLEPADIIYVNAAVGCPPAGWLEALLPGGRLIFPWKPSADTGYAMMVTRRSGGFAVEILSSAYFIGCTGAPDWREAQKVASRDMLARTTSLWLNRDRPPDESATAVFDDAWFSTKPIEDD